MYLRKQTLEELNLGELPTLADSQLDEAVEALKLHNYHTWLLPQLVQYFSSWRILADGKSTVLANCKTQQHRALWRLTRATRSTLVKGQNKHSEYSQLVPLFLLAHKRYNNRSYESWRDYPGLEWLVEPELYSSMTTQPPELDAEELRRITAEGLTTLAGKPKPAWSTHKLTGVTRGHPLHGLPRLTVVQLCQIWLAHPSVRHSDMILNHSNWDHMPPALVDWQPVKQPVKADETQVTTPWTTV
jgi:hypothetical protein